MLKSGVGYTKNIPTSAVTSLIYLESEKNYINPDAEPVLDSTTIEVKRKAAKTIVDRSVQALDEEDFLDIMLEDEETRKPEEIQNDINCLLEQISDAEDALKITSEQYENVSGQIIEYSDRISESQMIRNRYDALRSQYESDMRRLSFIAEADIHQDSLPKLEHCPFCNGELPKEKTESCIDAAIAEAERIEMRLKDLGSAAEAVLKEIKKSCSGYFGTDTFAICDTWSAKTTG